MGSGQRQGGERADEAPQWTGGRQFDKDGTPRADLPRVDGTARVWEAASGKPVSEPMKHTESVFGARFDKDGTRVLTWSGDFVGGTARRGCGKRPAASR